MIATHNGYDYSAVKVYKEITSVHRSYLNCYVQISYGQDLSHISFILPEKRTFYFDTRHVAKFPTKSGTPPSMTSRKNRSSVSGLRKNQRRNKYVKLERERRLRG